jgi:hypothetical protein
VLTPLLPLDTAVNSDIVRDDAVLHIGQDEASPALLIGRIKANLCEQQGHLYS